MKLILLISFVFFGQLYGQSQVFQFTGKLKDAETNQPIQYALLYLDGTTIGVTSDKNGEFVFEGLTLPIQIEISHLSYEPKSVYIEDENRNQLDILLSPRVVKLEALIIMRKSLRAEYVKKFNKWFIGNDLWGNRSKLVNDEALQFLAADEGFRVSASEPLIIKSSGLGYTIRAELKDFIVRSDIDGNETGFYIASYHFTPFEKGNFDNKRAKAYYNSSEHFLKSLYDNTTSQNGFIISKMFKYRDVQHLRSNSITLDANLAQRTNNEKLITGLNSQEFYILYHFKGKGPLNLDIYSPKNNYELSAIKFEEDEIILRSDGTTPGNAIVFSGAIAQKKVGAMLPNNYQPFLENTSTTPIDTFEMKPLPERLIRKRVND
jgi:hypothetical protein